MTSAWLESYGDVNRYDFTLNRTMLMDGFVHTAENFAKTAAGDGEFTDFAGKRAMAYYDQGILNYYYYMASQFAISDRWFSPVSSKSTPNRIATMTGGTTQGWCAIPLSTKAHRPAQHRNHLSGTGRATTFPGRSITPSPQGGCTDQDGDCGSSGHPSDYPVTTFSDFRYSAQVSL